MLTPQELYHSHIVMLFQPKREIIHIIYYAKKPEFSDDMRRKKLSFCHLPARENEGEGKINKQRRVSRQFLPRV